MATTSFLYHTLGLRGYRHLATRYEEGTVFHHVELRFEQRRCRGCGARCHDLILEGRFERVFRALPVGMRRQFVVLHGHEQRCRRCGEQLREPIPFCDGKRRHLRAFERYMVDLCKIATIKHVAGVLGIGWTAVKDAFKRHLRGRLKQRSLRGVRLIAIDEFATRKGHQYMTVVLNLETGEIIHAAERAAALLRSCPSAAPSRRRRCSPSRGHGHVARLLARGPRGLARRSPSSMTRTTSSQWPTRPSMPPAATCTASSTELNASSSRGLAASS